MKIVPEEKKLPELYAPNNPIIREIMGHNACRTEVLNNLKSKEMVEGIEEVLLREICPAFQRECNGDCDHSPYARCHTDRKNAMKLALAIQKALIQ